MGYFKGKKGMELSVNIIVLLIIGLTVLGLVIGFVTTLIGDTEQQFAGQLDQDDQQRLNEVAREPGNFVVSPTSLTVRSGSNQPEMLYIKARAYDEAIEDCVVGQLIDCQDFDIEIDESRGGGGDFTNEFTLTGPGFQIEDGAEEANAYELYVDGSVQPGTYYMRIIFGTGLDTSYSEVISVRVE